MKVKILPVLAAAAAMLLCACGSGSEAPEEVVAAAVVEESAPEVSVILVDGEKQVVIMDAAGKSVEELLTVSGITLNEGDLVTVNTESVVSESMTIEILRCCRISVSVTAEDGTETTCTAVLYGGSVEEALELLGIELPEGASVNVDPSTALTDGLAIVIEGVPAEAEEEEAEEEPAAQTSTNTNTNTNTNNNNSNTNTNTNTNTQTETNTKTVVNVDYYPDCVGEGDHGYKVITYDDGTQDTVEY